MKNFSPFIYLLMLAMLVGCATPNLPMTQASSGAPTIFMIGDSTMANKPVIPAYPERGWGQMLPVYFQDGVRIDNRALNGRSSKSFRDEGRWQPVFDKVQPGDFVIIQFGHNDEKDQDPTRYTTPFGTFKENLARYIREAHERGAKPILATSVARRKFDGQGRLQDTHGDYIIATRQVAAEQNVPLLELNTRSSELLIKMGVEESKRLYDWIPAGEFAKAPDGLKDDTHFNAYGASRMCDLAVEEIKNAAPELARWLKPTPK